MNDTNSYLNLLTFMKPMLQHEIDALAQRESENSTNYYISPKSIIKFVKLAKSTIGIFIDDDTTVQKLLSLLQSAVGTIDYRSAVVAVDSIRMKRSIENPDNNKIKTKRDTNIDVMHLTLDMSETLLNSNNETVVLMEKQRLPEYILSFMQKICIKPQFVSKVFGKVILRDI